MTDIWWILSSRHGGVHITRAGDATEARRRIRERIAEVGVSEGMSPSAAKQYAYSYNVYAVVGGCTEAEAREAHAAWDADDLEPAEALRRRYGPSRHRLTTTAPSSSDGGEV